MALDKLNIPCKIKVGFQQRSDTYTKKLGYVIYYDNKGKLRKETSWENWRSKDIKPEEFDNVPTEGFVLNKKAGGYKSGWDMRQTYIRVYDPRGFEIEISVPNLLFILEECSSVKGKGLEGSFVYAWDGVELVLLPTSSQEYIKSADFTKLQTKKVDKSDFKEGRLYLTKDNEEVMYLGRHEWSEFGYKYTRGGYNKLDHDYSYKVDTKKLHIFVNVKTGYYEKYAGFTKIGSMINSDCQSNYAEEYDKLKARPELSNDFKIEFSEFNLYEAAQAKIKQLEEKYKNQQGTGYYRNAFTIKFLGEDKKTEYNLVCDPKYNYTNSTYSPVYYIIRTLNEYEFNGISFIKKYIHNYYLNNKKEIKDLNELKNITVFTFKVINNTNNKILYNLEKEY